ncbi:MAG: LysR family transcriptional regulator [Pseudomonadota bacterium]
MIRNLDIAALRSLVAIADTRGVTRAASQVNLTQSAVSMQIKRLEALLDQKLLMREGRGVVLTKVGEQLVDYARRLIAINDEAWSRLTNDDFEGEVVLGVPPDLVNPVVPDILRQCTALYPRIRVTLLTRITNVLHRELEEGRADLILATEQAPDPRAETMCTLQQNWYGAAGGSAYLKRPLPLAICNNCAQKPAIAAALSDGDIAWYQASDADDDFTQEAITSADLGVLARIGGPARDDHEAVPEGTLPELPDVFVNCYRAAHRDANAIDRIADVVRDQFRRTYGCPEPEAMAS